MPGLTLPSEDDCIIMRRADYKNVNIVERSLSPKVGPEPVPVTLRVSRAKAPVPGGDIRELGAIIEGFGFR